MKRILTCICSAVLLLAVGCRNQSPSSNDFTVTQYNGEKQTEVKIKVDGYPDSVTLMVDNHYILDWPGDNSLSPEALKELFLCAFNDSTSTNFTQAINLWLSHPGCSPDDYPAILSFIQNRDSNLVPHIHNTLSCQYSTDSSLHLFHLNTESVSNFSQREKRSNYYIHIDPATRQVIHLCDLVDTTNMGEIIVRAVEDLVVNHETLLKLNDSYKASGRLPVPSNYYIDDTRSCITLVFQPNTIAPDSCGQQQIILPIFWLSKHTPLTQYAKNYFGEGSYLPE